MMVTKVAVAGHKPTAGFAGLLRAAALLHSLLHLTACLQSSVKVSSTVRGLAQDTPRVHQSMTGSKPVGVGCGCQLATWAVGSEQFKPDHSKIRMKNAH
jgi:hypothetical protein